MTVLVGDAGNQIVKVECLLPEKKKKAPSSRTSTAWSSDRAAAAMTAAGMRTEALLPHFFTMTFIALSRTADVA